MNAGTCPLQSYELLDFNECQKAIQDLVALQDLWVGRGSDPLYPYFYTLGAVAYLASGGRVHQDRQYAQIPWA